jgi:predicted nucleic acid-binding protein
MIQAAARTNLLTLEWVTPDVQERASEIYERYDDQTFSFWDCTSFAICDALNVDYVFGFDRDFQTAGFELRP